MTAQKLSRIAYVHLRHGLDAVAYRERFEAGLEPDLSPYGFHVATEMGYFVKFSEDHRGQFSEKIRKGLLRFVWFDIVHAFRNRNNIAECDVIWVMLEREALALSLLMWLKLIPKRPIIANIVWVLDKWNEFKPKTKSIYRWLLQKCDVLTVHSKYCLAAAKNIFQGTRCQLNYFGISSESFSPGFTEADRKILRIVGAGNDVTRDWNTLAAAFGNDDRFELIIVCKWLDPLLLEKYNNLTAPKNLSLTQFRDLYRGADYIAIPMHKNIYSGITVALEASAIGIGIISSDTGGVSTYFDETEALFAPVADAAAMKAAVLNQTAEQRQAMAKRARLKFLKNDYSTRGTVRRFIDITEEILPKP